MRVDILNESMVKMREQLEERIRDSRRDKEST